MKSPPPKAPFNLETIKQEVLADNQEIRGRAMQTLLLQARKDPGIHPHALEIFRQLFLKVPDAWTAISAARGIELIAGPDEGRQAWLALLNHSDSVIVGRVALSINFDSYVPVLLDLLHHRPETSVQCNVARALGRLKNPIALSAIVKQLATPALRRDAIEALGDLGDVRAIPHLEALLNDKTETGKQDERGAMLRICDLASDAIRRFSAHPGQNINHALNKSYWDLPESNWEPPSPRPAPKPPPLPSRLSPQVLAYIPIVAAVLEIPWTGIVIIGVLFLTGTFKPNQNQTRLIAIIAMLPAVVGLSTGITVIVSKPSPRLIDRVFLGIGFSICGLIIIWLGQELFR